VNRPASPVKGEGKVKLFNMKNSINQTQPPRRYIPKFRAIQPYIYQQQSNQIEKVKENDKLM